MSSALFPSGQMKLASRYAREQGGGQRTGRPVATRFWWQFPGVFAREFARIHKETCRLALFLSSLTEEQELWISDAISERHPFGFKPKAVSNASPARGNGGRGAPEADAGYRDYRTRS